jgi:hypothetical protein
MKLVIKAAFVCLATGAAALASSAKEVSVGSTTIRLALPSGYCELADSNANDADLLKTMRDLLRENLLLAVYADCSQLANVRSGKAPGLDDFAQYFTPLSAVNAKFSPGVIKQVCAKMREQGERKLANLAQDSTRRVEEFVKGLKINETQFVGVVAEEDNTCYTATPQKFTLNGGNEKVQFNLSAALVLIDKFVHYHIFTPYRGARTVSELLTRHKANVATLLAANKSN